MVLGLVCDIYTLSGVHHTRHALESESYLIPHMHMRRKEAKIRQPKRTASIIIAVHYSCSCNNFIQKFKIKKMT